MKTIAPRDDLDQLIDEFARTDPEVRARVDAALERRVLARDLAARRRAAGLTQVEPARRMGTSQAQVTRFESGPDAPLDGGPLRRRARRETRLDDHPCTPSDDRPEERAAWSSDADAREHIGGARRSTSHGRDRRPMVDSATSWHRDAMMLLCQRRGQP